MMCDDRCSTLGAPLNITIQQQPVLFRSEYEISTPGCIYVALSNSLPWRDVITITKPNREVLACVRSRFGPFKSSYDLELQEGRLYRSWCEKMWKGVFACEGADENFRLYEHKGLRFSVFQDENQIAAFAKNSIVVGQSECYEIRVNDDANFVVVVCMALIVASEYRGQAATITVDLGNIGPEEKPYDERWEPS